MMKYKSIKTYKCRTKSFSEINLRKHSFNLYRAQCQITLVTADLSNHWQYIRRHFQLDINPDYVN